MRTTRRTRWAIWCLLVVSSTVAPAAQRGGGDGGPNQFVGTWAGTWEGAGSGSGHLELTLAKGKDATMTGRLAVTSDDPADDVNYSVDLKNLSFEGKQMRASYDVPSDPDSQVLLVASFDGTRAAGTWSIRPSGSAQDSMNGRWSVTRK